PPRRPPPGHGGRREGGTRLDLPRLVRRPAAPGPDPGLRRRADPAVALRGLLAALRRPDPAPGAPSDPGARPAGVPVPAAGPPPRVRSAPLVLPAVGAAGGAARGQRDAGGHGDVRGAVLLPPDPRPAAIGAGDGVLFDREPRGRLPLLAPLRADVAARAVALA